VSQVWVSVVQSGEIVVRMLHDELSAVAHAFLYDGRRHQSYEVNTEVPAPLPSVPEDADETIQEVPPEKALYDLVGLAGRSDFPLRMHGGRLSFADVSVQDTRPRRCTQRYDEDGSYLGHNRCLPDKSCCKELIDEPEWLSYGGMGATWVNRVGMCYIKL